MTPLITILILSSIVLPGGNLNVVFSLSNTTPACGNTIYYTVKIYNVNYQLISTYSSSITVPMEEVLKGSFKVSAHVPVNVTQPGTYVAVVSASYCSTNRVGKFAFKVAGVQPVKYSQKLNNDLLSYTLTLSSDFPNETVPVVVTLRAVSDLNDSVADVETLYIDPNSTATATLTVNLTSIKGSLARVTLFYSYDGVKRTVTTADVPIPRVEKTGENTKNPYYPVIFLSVIAGIYVLLVVGSFKKV